ncbi:MAG TPA: type II secretion system minor pseudopilin GspJ [Steroidobacteraceae bacterium]|nr:type II secretion system minor pseudopilin GspJ [Steroidobacteraceae bacterium]
MKPANAAHAGFTLIELLVAMFITAIVFAMGYGALNQALGNRKALEAQAARLLEVQKALRVMEQDFELLQPRPVRKSLGDGYDGALVAPNTQTSLGSVDTATTSSSPAGTGNNTDDVTLGSDAQPLVAFTRGGWTNPAGLQRSELQRVSYYVDQGELIRMYMPVLDAVAGDVPVKRQLLSGVKSLSFRFMDGNHTWQQGWPAGVIGNAEQTATLRIRPVAVEITVQLKDYSTLVRVVEVAG